MGRDQQWDEDKEKKRRGVLPQCAQNAPEAGAFLRGVGSFWLVTLCRDESATQSG
jgi:hypothetical protein